MIIDSHIHLYPSEASSDPHSWAQSRHEPYWLSCVKPDQGPQLQGWASGDQLLSDMDAASVDKAIILGWYWENPSTCYEQNEWMQQAVALHPDRLHYMASFNAKGGQHSLDDIQRAFNNGALGIGELNPPAQGYTYDNPTLSKALQLTAEAKRCANFHVTEPAGHSYPGKIDTPLADLQNLAKNHPDTQFIFAHLGGLLPFYEFNSSTHSALNNVVYDTAATPLLYSKKVYRSLCDAIGHERILFGTDYPLKTFPKLQSTPDFKHHIERLKNAQLNETELISILGTNAKRVFNF